MSGDDTQDIWSSYAKGVKRLGEKEEPEIKAKPPRARKKELVPTPAPEGMPENIELPLPVIKELPPSPKPQPVWKPEPLDLRVERNMSLGDVFIEAKLDLHGQTEQAAYEAFGAFVEKQQARGKRMLLVITGKGADGASVLRANLPRWCLVPPFINTVMAVRTAAQHHGGEGAYYVLLRKKN